MTLKADCHLFFASDLIVIAGAGGMFRWDCDQCSFFLIGSDLSHLFTSPDSIE